MNLKRAIGALAITEQPEAVVPGAMQSFAGATATDGVVAARTKDLHAACVGHKGRRGTIRRVSESELARFVEAPAEKVAISNPATIVVAGDDIGPASAGDQHRRRERAIRGHTISETAMKGSSPAVEVVAMDTAGMEPARGESCIGVGGVGNGLWAEDGFRDRAGSGLSRIICAPAERPCVSAGADMVIPDRYVGPVGLLSDLGGRPASLTCAVANRTVTPAIEQPVSDATGSSVGGGKGPACLRSRHLLRGKRLQHILADPQSVSIAPAIESGIGSNPTRVTVASGDEGPVTEGSDSNGRRSVNFGAVAHRAYSPTPELSVLDTTCQKDSCGDHAPLGRCVLAPRTCWRDIARPDSDLSEDIEAGTGNVSIGASGAQMKVAGGKILPVRKCPHARRGRDLLDRRKPKLAMMIAAPAVEFSTASKTAYESVACADLRPVTGCSHAGRGCTTSCRAISDLARGVGPPTPELPVSNATCVERSYRDVAPVAGCANPCGCKSLPGGGAQAGHALEV